MARIYRPKNIISEPVIRHRLPKTGASYGQSDAAPFNVWFDQEFPEAASQFGPGFLEGRYEDLEGETHYIPEVLNIDPWAAALGGRRDLGLQVVYHAPEAHFYFWDYRACESGAFCPVSAEKLQVLLSVELMRCAQAMTPLVDIEPLVTKFRAHESIRAVVEKAKTILEADPGFFSGNHGKARMVGAKLIEPNALPGYVQFVKKAIVREPTAKLTVSRAFSRYYGYCNEVGESPLTRSDFKALISEVIRQEFSLGIRNDIKDDRGKAQHGWAGIDCCFGRN